MSEFNPGRIDAAIRCRGWTKKDLACRAGVSQTTIGRLTKGTLEFNEDAARLIAFATGLPIAFFILRDNPVEESELTFRRQSRMPRRKVAQIVQEYNLLADAADRLADMNGITGRGEWLDLLAPGGQPDMDDVERIAMETRAHWGLPDSGPIRNVTRMMERDGIVVAPLATHVEGAVGDGVTSPGPDRPRPVVGCLEDGRPGDRIRFTLAHELGHLVLHRRRRPTDPKLAELEANSYAGALLLPRRDATSMLSHHPRLSDYVAVKAGWGLSIAASISTSLRMGIIDDERRRSLMIQMANRQWNRREPVEVPRERPTLLKQMTGQALGECSDPTAPTVSKTAVENYLGLPFDLVNHWCDFGLSMRPDEMEIDGTL